MIELVLIVLFSWNLHKMAYEKGLSAWKWVTRFVTGYFLFGVLLSIGLYWYYGPDKLTNVAELQQLILPFTPFVLLFIVGWFLFLRRRLNKFIYTEEAEEDDNQQDEEPPQKKDLSYFR